MALLMVHLLVARRWAQRHEEYLESPEFYLGAISPDAIHVRDGNDKSRKDEIHLYNWKSLHERELLDYWRQHHTPFDVGYGIHSLTDAQWVPRFRTRLPQLLMSDGKLDTATYYNDTFATDFQLYDRCGGEGLFAKVGLGRAPEDHPLLSGYEIDEWRKQMIDRYRGECPAKQPTKYIDWDYVMSFMDDCQPLLDDIWRRFWNE